MSLIGLICYIVEYTAPRLRWLGWRQGIWQLVPIIREAVRVYDGTFFERRKKCYRQFTVNLNGPIDVLGGDDIHG